MARFRILAGTALALVVGAIVGTVGNFLLENALFLGSEYQLAAAGSLGFVLVVLAIFASAGTP